MTRRTRILRNIAIGFVALVVAFGIVAITVVQTDWFRNYVRQKIVSATEEAIGGRVEAGAFLFDWRHLHAELTNFVIHGTEPSTADPLFRTPRIQVDLRLLTSFKRIVNVSALRVEQPRANIMTFADGTMNIPQPPKKSTDDTTPLETVVDLAIGHFDLSDGTIRYNDATYPLDVRGENLQVQLAYNLLTRGYQGNLSLQPLYVVEGRRTPVVFTLSLPVVLERDQISIKDATITTPLSKLNVAVSLANLRQPVTTVRMSGSVAVTDLNNLAGLSLANDPATSTVFIDADARLTNDSITVQKLHAALGASQIDASGVAKDVKGRSKLDFKSDLDLGELVRLAKSSQKLSGTVNVAGTSQFDGTVLQLENLRVRGFGGELTGEARIEEFIRFHTSGKLVGMNLQSLEQRLGMTPLPYDGTIGGSFEAEGNVKAPGVGLQAQVKLKISPGKRGVPISGVLDAFYTGRNGVLKANNSYLALPHSRLNFAGSIQNGIQVDLTSEDLADLFAAIPGPPPPVKLAGGKLAVSAAVSGTVDDPHIAGHAATTSIAFQDRRFDTIATDFSVAKSGLELRNGLVTRGAMQGAFNGTVGLLDWSPKPDRPLALTATIGNGDLADALALAGQKTDGYSGALTATVNIAGTIRNPSGSANIAVDKGTVAEEPFDQLRVQVALADRSVRVPSAYLTRDQSRVDLTADFQHPRDSFTTGHLQAHVTSNQIELAGVRNVQTRRPATAGSLQMDVTVAGDLATVHANNTDETEFQLKSVAGTASAKGIRLDGENYGDVNVGATTSGDTVSYSLTSNFASSQTSATGRTQLKQDYPSVVDAKFASLPIERVLAAAKRTDIAAKGVASGILHFDGTIKDPQGNGEFELSKAVLYEEPVDRLRLRITVQPTSIDVAQLEAAEGQSQLAVTGRFDHPRNVFDEGTLTFRVKNGRLDLAHIRNVQNLRPGLIGAVAITGEGKANVRASGADRIAVEDLKARIDATDLQSAGHKLGNIELTATGSGDKVQFALSSDLAAAALKGQGTATLRGDYPLKADLTFDNLSWANLQPLVSGGVDSPVDAVASGKISVDGPVANIDQLNASLRVTKIEVHPVQTARSKPLVLQNQGDIALSMQKGLVRVESAHMTGQDTDITISGTGSSKGDKLDFRLNAKTNLGLLRSLSTDIYSSGTVTVAAAVQGSLQKPSVTGKLELQGASVTSGDLPVGLSNANGVIAFNGNTATIQTLTGEAGGGKVTIRGFVTRGDTLRFGLEANASGVRVRVQQGVSVVATANIKLSGTTDGSLASGLVTIDRLTYLPQTDMGSILTRAGPSVQTPDNPSPLLQNMALDIAVRTSSSTSIQASLAQNLQVSSDLRIRGRASQPGITGAIQLNQGQLAFFGSTYQLTSGTISFFNPRKVDPQINIALTTQAKGVTVVLSVTGPMDNLKLTYTSDPPLQFEEIVALLASGKTPTSDPTLLANQPADPPQTFEQRGESAIVGKALADPVSSRLQRVFGVSQLKIDPTFTSGSQLPQARVTLQQQVASNLLFTYVTALDNPNTQIITIEWSLNPQWSATANRDENGIFSINLLYKKQFR